MRDTLMPARNPRLTLTLPAGIYRAFEWWAEREGSKSSAIASSLIENFVRERVNAGQIPFELLEPEPEQPSEVIAPEARESLQQFLSVLASGKCPDMGQLSILAHDLDLDEDTLSELCDRVTREGTTNGV